MEIDQIFVGIHVRVTRLVSSLIPPAVRSGLIAASIGLSLFLLTSLIALHHQHIHPHGTVYQLNAGDGGQEGGGEGRSEGFPSLVRWMDVSDVVRLHIHPPCPQYRALALQGWSCWWRADPHINVSREGQWKADSSRQPDTAAASSPPPPHTELGRGTTAEETEGAREVLSVGVDVADAAESGVSAFSPSVFFARALAVPPNWSSSPALSNLGSAAPAPRSSSSHPSSSPSSAAFPSAPASSPAAYRFEWAHHKGFFLLPSSLYSRHSIATTTVHMAASHPSFGPFPLSLLTYHLFGYDSIVFNHLLRQRSEGFMRNVDTRDITPLHMQKAEAQPNPQAAALTSSSSPALSLTRLLHLLYLLFFKSELLLTTLFLFFATTTLVSSTLTATQLRMLSFTDALRQHLRLHLPIVGLVLEHTMQSLSFVPVVVGILFFLFEFFNDQLLAFLLLITVWLCESYTVLFTRTSTSMLYFPKLFALYFTMFGVYFFSFPYGFHYIAITLTAAQLYTCMAYYFFHFEIPAVEQGLISIHRPRMLVLRRNEGDAQHPRRGSAAGAAGGAAAADGEGRAAAASRSSRSNSASAGAGGRVRGREHEQLLVRLLGLWDERRREDAEEPSSPARADAAAGEEAEAEALDFSRREVRRESHPLREPRPRDAGAAEPSAVPSVATSTSVPPPGATSAAVSPPWRPLQSTASSAPSSASFTLESFVPPPPSAAVPSFSRPLQPLSPLLSLQVTPSPAPSRSSSSASSASSTSQPSSPPAGPPAAAPTAHPITGPPASDSLQQLHSLPPLLRQLLKAVQDWTPSSSSAAPHRSLSRPHRALSSSKDSPYSAPLTPRSRHSSHPQQPLDVAPAPTTSPLFESKEEAPVSPQPVAAAQPPPPPPPIPPASAVPDTASLHRSVLEQLAYVLQVSLFVLTSLQLHAEPAALQAPASTAVAESTAAAPASPRPQSPFRPASSPRPSPPRGSPSSSRQPPSSLSSSPASASRRLLFPAPDSSPRSSDAAQGAGELLGGSSPSPTGSAGPTTGQAAQRRPAVEPPSPDPSADAPMM